MTGEAETDLSICVISTGNQPQLAIDCLRTLMDSLSGSITCDIWFVDNATPSRVGETIKASHPNVHVIRNEEKKGFAYNNNMIWRMMKSRYFMILNDDTMIVKNFCEAMIAAADAHQNGGFFGPRILNSDQTLQRSAYRLPSPARDLMEAFGLPKIFAWIPSIDDYRNWQHDEFREVEFLIGAALMGRSQMLADIGGLDEEFFIYAEDTDWCKRASEAGWKLYLVPEAVMIHLGGQSSVGMPQAKHVEFLRSHYRYIRKHFGLFGLALYRMAEFIKHSSRWAFHSLVANQEASNVHKEAFLWSIGLLKAKGLKELAAESKS